MANTIHRVALFNIPSLDDQNALIQAYERVKETNEKDGKKYIMSMSVGLAEEDVRAQGFTVIAQLVFGNMEHVRFYDTDCPAHQALKSVVKTLAVSGNIITTTVKPLVIST